MSNTHHNEIMQRVEESDAYLAHLKIHLAEQDKTRQSSEFLAIDTLVDAQPGLREALREQTKQFLQSTGLQPTEIATHVTTKMKRNHNFA